MKAELLLHVPDTKLAEGPVWDHRSGLLHWVDIPNGRLHTYDPSNGENQWIEFDQMIGAAVPSEKGGFILALQHGFYKLKEGGELMALMDPEANEPLNRFNDGKCDPAGRFWAGSMRIELPRLPVSALYCLDERMGVEKKVAGVQLSNGMAWTRDHRTMYYIDTHLLRLDAFDFELTSGKIDNRRTVLEFAEDEFPDGMCIDEEDHVWIAFYGKGKVVCFDVERKERLLEIEVPAARTTSCCFGGRAFDTLFITTASGDGKPYEGALFYVKPGVKGRPANFFKA
ncbi:MAG: SMP-30/gluconolactonase/LRE family protein [Bacteroidia bacterium]|nr:SMP-30/gluconolactonase/LRE family protein [Bacteroidia bacterium]